MSDNYLGEIRIFAGNYAPEGWMKCDGSSLSVMQYQALYALIGNIYGGDSTSFKVPDLRGRLPMHYGQGGGLTNRPLGSQDGLEMVALTATTLASHTHAFQATSANATTTTPGSTVTYGGLSGGWLMYVPDSVNVSPAAFNSLEMQKAGGSQPHINLMPGIALTYIIATAGVWPQRSN